MMDMEISSHHAENTRCLGTTEILRSSFRYRSMHSPDQFVMSKSSVIMKFMDSRLKSLLHVETIPIVAT